MQLEPHKSFALRSDAAAHSTLGLRPANGVAMAASGVGPLLRDKRPVPGENGLGTDEGCKLREQCPAEGLSLDGVASALNVSELHSAAAKLRAEDAFLLPQVVDGVLLVSAEPVGEDQEPDLDQKGLLGRNGLDDRRRNLSEDRTPEHPRYTGFEAMPPSDPEDRKESCDHNREVAYF